MTAYRTKRLRIPRPFIKLVIFCLGLLPLVALIYDGVTANLGANPIETITHRTGEWALHFMLITLAVSPLRQWLGIKWLGGMRRMLGLYTFFYASLHVLTYIVLEQFFDWPMIASELIKRPYLTVGMLAFLALIPLALTSLNVAIRWLGKARWRLLHRLVYFSATACVLHYLWLVKADYREPVMYALVLVVLLMARVVKERKIAFFIHSHDANRAAGRSVSRPR